MRLLQGLRREPPSPCPYLPGRQMACESFLADRLDPLQLGRLLAAGWRKFGPYFFRPVCPGCRECTPVRVPVSDFVPSRSQRRVLRNHAGVQVDFVPLSPSPRIYEIYREHALRRFGQTVDPEGFLLQFYTPPAPGLQSEFRRGGELIGVGFLDLAGDALSSVYFCFDPVLAPAGLGTFSVLAEITQARQLGLRHYHLGYFVPGSPRLAYKDRFRPREYFDWIRRTWLPAPA